MAALDSDKVQNLLLNKLGCVPDEGKDHRYYILKDAKGTILARTKISHGPKHTITDNLVTAMARQIKLGTAKNFVAFVQCTLSKEECLKIIEAASS